LFVTRDLVKANSKVKDPRDLQLQWIKTKP
jgi:hypothetical protein